MTFKHLFLQPNTVNRKLKEFDKYSCMLIGNPERPGT